MKKPTKKKPTTNDRLEELEKEMSNVFDMIANNQDVIKSLCEIGKLNMRAIKEEFERIEKEPLLTREELSFTLSEIEFSFKSQWHNGDFEEFSQCTDNSEKSFNRQVSLLKSIISKLKEEKNK